MSELLQQLQEILKEAGFIYDFDYELNIGASVRFEPVETTDEKIAKTPINIDPLGCHDFKNIEVIKNEFTRIHRKRCTKDSCRDSKKSEADSTKSKINSK